MGCREVAQVTLERGITIQPKLRNHPLLEMWSWREGMSGSFPIDILPSLPSNAASAIHYWSILYSLLSLPLSFHMDSYVDLWCLRVAI